MCQPEFSLSPSLSLFSLPVQTDLLVVAAVPMPAFEECPAVTVDEVLLTG